MPRAKNDVKLVDIDTTDNVLSDEEMEVVRAAVEAAKVEVVVIDEVEIPVTIIDLEEVAPKSSQDLILAEVPTEDSLESALVGDCNLHTLPDGRIIGVITSNLPDTPEWDGTQFSLDLNEAVALGVTYIRTPDGSTYTVHSVDSVTGYIGFDILPEDGKEPTPATGKCKCSTSTEVTAIHNRLGRFSVCVGCGLKK